MSAVSLFLDLRLPVPVLSLYGFFQLNLIICFLAITISFSLACVQAVLSNSDLLAAVLRTEEEPLTVVQQRSVGGKKL
jgi:hypothetical protein